MASHCGPKAAGAAGRRWPHSHLPKEPGGGGGPSPWVEGVVGTAYLCRRGAGLKERS